MVETMLVAAKKDILADFGGRHSNIYDQHWPKFTELMKAKEIEKRDLTAQWIHKRPIHIWPHEVSSSAWILLRGTALTIIMDLT